MINPPPVAAKDTHIQEWVEGSVVSEALADLNIVSLSDPKEIAKLLNWSHYYGSPGWAVRGIDLVRGATQNSEIDRLLLKTRGDGE